MPENNESRAIQRGVRKANTLATKLGFVAIGLILGLLLGIGGALFFEIYNPPDKSSETEPLHPTIVFDRIKKQDEMISASQNYSIIEKVGDVNKIPFTDIPIPFTNNSFWYRYVGTIKAGVNLKTANPETIGNKIVFTLDTPFISSNTPDMEQSGVLEENNNILNPIHVEDVDALQRRCIEQSETKSIENGLLDEARANAEQNIKNLINAALGDKYTVEFVWRGLHEA